MKVAIVKLSAMGDIIQTAFVLQFLKEFYHDRIVIDWICEEVFAPILEDNPHINKIHKLDLKSIKNKKSNIFKEIKKVKQISKENYDIIIDFQGNIKSAIVSRLIGKNIYGFDKNSVRERPASLLYKKGFDIPYHLDTMDRYRILVNKIFDINITKEQVLDKKPYLFYHDKGVVDEYFYHDRKNIVFIIGASWDSKIYPKELVQKVIDSIDANFIVPYSNKKEEDFVDSLSPVTKVKLNLDELKALISRADLVIGNDTGPTYIAWANNIPSITLFGPVPPNRVYETKINKLLKSPSKVNPYKLNRQDYSIKDIKPERIASLAKELLG